MKFHISLVLATLLFACNAEEKSQLKEGWDRPNTPSKIDPELRLDFKFRRDLLRGQPKNLPWTDDYWPSYHGGISFRWNWNQSRLLQSKEALLEDEFAGQQSNDTAFQTLRKEVLWYPTYSVGTLDAMTEEERSKAISLMSPAEKLDLYRGAYDFPTVKNERIRTGIGKTIQKPEEDRLLSENDFASFGYSPDEPIATWEGICHAWAPATIYFEKEPKRTKLQSLDGKYTIDFGSSDIKALLSHAIDRDDRTHREGEQVGQRCDTDMSLTHVNKIGKKFGEVAASVGKDTNRQVITDALTYVGNSRQLTLPSAIGVIAYLLNFADDRQWAQQTFAENAYAYRPQYLSQLPEYEERIKKYKEMLGAQQRLSLSEAVRAVPEILKSRACNDVNAGAFHVLLTNVIGIEKKSFVIDKTRDLQVWNQPIASYSSKIIKEYGSEDFKHWPKNVAKGTTKVVEVFTELRYSTELSPSMEPHAQGRGLQHYHAFAGTGDERSKGYRYFLELNNQEEIIGGTWIVDDYHERPDFLWTMKRFSLVDDVNMDIQYIYDQSIE